MKKYSMTKEGEMYRITARINLNNVINGEKGGLITKEANLSHSGDAWVFGDARVYGDAQVSGDAQVFGHAQVSGDAQVYDTAQVSGHAQVFGNAWVFSTAQVYDTAQVFGNAWVFSTAQVYDTAQVSGGARVFSTAQVYDTAQVSGGARVFGDAQVYGTARVYGNAWVVTGKHSTSLVFIHGSMLSVFWDGNIGCIRSGCICKPIGWWDEHLVRFAEEHGYTPEQIEEYKIYFEAVKKWMVLKNVI